VSGDIAQLFLKLGTRRGEWSASRPGRLYARGRPGTHCTGGWVGPGAGLDRCGKSRPAEIRSPDLQARSESLYLLRYPGSSMSKSSSFSSQKLGMHDDSQSTIISMQSIAYCLLRTGQRVGSAVLSLLTLTLLGSRSCFPSHTGCRNCSWVDIRL
jgi:hypothetical protein